MHKNLTNPSLRCALFQPITETDSQIGNMIETAVYAQWIPRLGANITYANWRQSKTAKGEVDIVGIDIAKQKPNWAVEIKWSDRYVDKPQDLTSLLYFMSQTNLEQAIVTSKTKLDRHQMDSGLLQFIPVACYAYIVGKNTIYMNRNLYGL